MQRFLRKLAVGAVEPHGKLGGQVINRQKFNQAPNTGLLLEAFGHFLCLFFADAGDLRQLHGVLLQNVQALLAEAGDDLLRHLRSDALDGAGRQKRQNLARRFRHEAL